MPSFENIHRNKKLAFIDGLLCGVLLTYFIGPVLLDQYDAYDKKRRKKKQ